MSNEGTPTTNGAPGAKPKGERRARKGGAKNESFIYCLEAGNNEGGKLQLSKPDVKDEILLAALKSGVPYYRLQKFTATVERTTEGLKIVGVPVE
jgi:hypothetical protein